MLRKLQKNKSEGFTIIEVMIVLAIAGLIMLIVFLAVPALQRNSRNTQRKNDISAITAGINEYVSNSNGALPKGFKITGNTITICDNSGCAAASAITANAKVGYYTAVPAAPFAQASDPGYGLAPVNTNFLFKSASAAAAPAAQVSDKDNFNVITGATCNDTNTAAVAGPARSFAITYETEAGGSSVNKVCQGS